MVLILLTLGGPVAWASGAEYGAIEACRDGVGEACRLAAEAYFDGDGVPRDVPAGVEMLAEACHLGSAECCVDLAARYEQGLGVPSDPALALEWSAAACEQGEGPSCRRVAEALARDAEQQGWSLTDVLEGTDSPVAWFERGCQQGDPDSCLAAAEAHEAKGSPRLTPEAVLAYQRACLSDLLVGCTKVAWHLQGRSPAAASPWFQAGCDLGDVDSCREYGLWRGRQQGGREVAPEARQPLQTACEADDPAACAGLAELLRRADPPAALDAASRACGLGVDKSCRRAWKLRRKVERGP